MRVSTDGQADNGYSLSAQEKAIQEFAKAQEMRLVRVYRDEGVSGTLDQRPALAEALAELEARKADYLVVYRLDRLARDLVLQETILSRLEGKGVEVVSVSEPDIGGTDPTRVLVRQVLGAISQYEKAVIRARMLAGKQTKAARGGYVGGRPPYGRRAESKKLTPHPEEQRVVDAVIAARRDGLSLRQIAERLEAGGYQTRAGGRWHPKVIRSILLRTDTG